MLDLNYLLARHQVSLVASQTAASEAARSAHLAFAEAYMRRIEEIRSDLGATVPIIHQQ